MKKILLLVQILFSTASFAQNHFTTHLNPEGDTVSYEYYFSYIVSGDYKVIYDRKSNTRTLIPNSEEKYVKEKKKTEKRISINKNIGLPFPSFDVTDLETERITLEQLEGKIVVLNFWFIGCVPCEMERPVLNTLRELYIGNDEVVFLAFAKNEKDRLLKFLEKHPISYTVIPCESNFIKAQFGIDSYPQNIVLDRKGNYFFESSGGGIGIAEILRKRIDSALAN